MIIMIIIRRRKLISVASIYHTRWERRASVCIEYGGYRISFPEGRPGMSDVHLLSGISGLSFESAFLSPLFIFFCLVHLFFMFVIFLLMVFFFWSFFFSLQKTQIFFVKG